MLSPCLFNQDFEEHLKSVFRPLIEEIGLLITNYNKEFLVQYFSEQKAVEQYS